MPAPVKTPKTLKIRAIGNSLGVVLPKEVLQSLGAGEGDELMVADTEAGVELRRKDAQFEDHMRRVETIMARYPNTLKALAR